LERGADADRRNDRGQTPLGGGAFKGYEEIVDLLLEHGADIDADNGGGMTPLMFAAMFGRTRVVEQLKAHGASLKQRNRLGISANWMVRCSRFVVRILGKRQPERAL
jgi:ankyrin repeat protein